MKRILLAAALGLRLVTPAHATDWWGTDTSLGTPSDCFRSQISPLESAQMDGRTLVDRDPAVTIVKGGQIIFVYFRTEALCQQFLKIRQEKAEAEYRKLDKYR